MQKILFILFPFLFITFSFAKKEDINVQLQWKHQFQFAGYYIAKEKGFYDDINLNVTLLEYKQNTNTIKNVLTQKINYAIGRTSLINQRSHGKKVVLLSSLLQSSPLALVTKKNSNINTIEDFKNRQLTITKNEAQSAIFPLFLSKNISKDDISIKKSLYKLKDFIEDKTDIITLYTSNQEYELIKNNIDYNIFHPKDYDFDFYDDILYTSQKEYYENTKRTIEFTKASLKGWEYAFNNIDETISIILEKYNTQKKTRQDLLYEANILKELAYKDNIPIGTINKNKIQRIYDIYNLMGFTKDSINLNNFVMNTSNSLPNSQVYSNEEILYLKSNKIIKMCNNPNWEPIEFAPYRNMKKMSGIAIDTLAILEKKLNIKFENVYTNSWIQSQEYLKAKKCDILPAAIQTNKRSEYANFTDPYLSLPLAIFTSKGKPLINNISEVIDKTWTRNKGSGLIHTMTKNYPEHKLIMTDTVEEAFLSVNSDKSYFTIATLPVASNLISKYRLNNVQIAGYSNIKYQISIAVRNDKLVLKDILNKALKEIPQKEHKKILKEWITNTKSSSFDKDIIINISIVLVLCAILLFYRQYLLKKTNSNLQNLVNAKTHELKELNDNLEIRIKNAINKNSEQDKLIHSQAKMASMGEMIGNIAHQWRQPLSVISTGVTGMQVQKEFGLLTDEKFEDTCQIINNNAQYLSKTIDDFKNFIKGDRIKVSFSLRTNLSTFVNLVNGSIKKENIQLIINVDEKIIINGYKNELVQCFINIFNNAKDALQIIDKNERILIISAQENDNHILMNFQDNANGIDDTILNKVFEPYFTTKHKSQGTGLGLNMTYKLIVEGMHGNILVTNSKFLYNNKEYYGANFQIELPKN